MSRILVVCTCLILLVWSSSGVSQDCRCPGGGGALFAHLPVGDDTQFTSSFQDVASRRNLAVLDTGAFGDKGLLEAKQIAINLFEDVNVTATRVESEARTPHNQVWYGLVEGDPHSHVVITQTQGLFALSLNAERTIAGVIERANYLAMPTLRGVHEIFEVDEQKLPLMDDFPPAKDSNRGPAWHALAGAARDSGLVPLSPLDGRLLYKPHRPPGLTKIRDDRSQIDIMVVYTPSAAEQMSPSPASVIDLAVALANASFIFGGVNTRLNLVTDPWMVVDMELDNIGQDLTALTVNGEGFGDGLHQARDLWAADVVTLFTSNNLDVGRDENDELVSSPVCGKSWQHSSTRTLEENAAYGFNVVSTVCSITRFSFTHEYGHIFGTTHDVNATIIEDSADSFGNVPGIKTRARGYVLLLQEPAQIGLRTIMGVGYECPALDGKYCDRLLRWSDPLYMVYGAPLGIPAGFDDAADNVGVLNFSSSADDTLGEIANYRRSVCRFNPKCL